MPPKEVKAVKGRSAIPTVEMTGTKPVQFDIPAEIHQRMKILAAQKDVAVRTLYAEGALMRLEAEDR